jgi:hypothetical protein
VLCQHRGPFDGITNVREFGRNVGEDADTDFKAFTQDPQSILAHFLAGEQFGAESAKFKPV